MAQPVSRPPPNDADVERSFEAAPPNLIAEIIHGVLHLQPRPARAHTSVASNLGFVLGPPFRLGRGGPGGWVILYEPELHFGPRPDKLTPDLAGWRRSRMPDAVGGDLAPAYYDLSPDWVCEVLSPSTETTDRGDKMPIYAREGVGHAWLVDPIARIIEVFVLENGAFRLVGTHRGSARVRAVPFDAIDLELELIFQP